MPLTEWKDLYAQTEGNLKDVSLKEEKLIRRTEGRQWFI